MLARPILQEYDASTVDLAMNPAESGKLAARHNPVEVAEACQREADACTMDAEWSMEGAFTLEYPSRRDEASTFSDCLKNRG